MAADSIDDGSEFLVAILVHRFALIVAFGLLGAAAGWAYGNTQQPTHISSTSVLINPVEGSPYAPSGFGDNLTSLETEAEIVRSDAVVQRASDKLDRLVTPETLEAGVDVQVPPSTQVLLITFAASDANDARLGAQALADSFLEYRQQRAEAVLNDQVAAIEAQMEKVLADLRSATAASRRGPEESRTFQGELARALSSELVGLRTERAALRNAPPAAGRVLSPASVPPDPSNLLRLVTPVGGAFAGLLVGFIIATLLERNRGLVWSDRDIEADGVPVLATVRGRRTSGSNRHSVRLAYSEAIRRVRSVILNSGQRPSIVTIGCASELSVEPGIAGALARSLAQAGERVVLVDAVAGTDASGQSTQTGPGLADLLEGHADAGAGMLSTPDEWGIRRLAFGHASADSADLFVQDRLSSTLVPLLTECDFLVIRAPSLGLTAGEALADVADVTVAWAVAGVTRRSEIRSLARLAERTDSSVMHGLLLPRSWARRGWMNRVSSVARPAGSGRSAGQGKPDGRTDPMTTAHVA